MKHAFFFLFFPACELGLQTSLKPFDTAGEPDFTDTGKIIDTGNTPDTEPQDTGWDTDSQDTGWDTDTQDTGNPQDTGITEYDWDGDGYTPSQGDCDDTNPNIFPFTFDDCDGIDNDCDFFIDEDAAQDNYEPNDINAYDIGYYVAGDYYEIEGVMNPTGDTDIFEFYIEDGDWDWFGIEVDLHAIDLNTDFALELWIIEDAEGRTNELLFSSNSGGSGLGESGSYGGSWLDDNSGRYKIIVTAVSGHSCNSVYTVDLWASP